MSSMSERHYIMCPCCQGSYLTDDADPRCCPVCARATEAPPIARSTPPKRVNWPAIMISSFMMLPVLLGLLTFSVSMGILPGPRDLANRIAKLKWLLPAPAKVESGPETPCSLQPLPEENQQAMGNRMENEKPPEQNPR